jgi:hypothetical protein
MGRLTLNVLLSFAQFEREVTGERIRDKIAASKKKGLWMCGQPALGYDVEDRKLINLVTEHIADRLLQPDRLEEILAAVLASTGWRCWCRRCSSVPIGDLMLEIAIVTAPALGLVMIVAFAFQWVSQKVSTVF